MTKADLPKLLVPVIIAMGLAISIPFFLNPIAKALNQANIAHAAKPDSCRVYQERAKEYLELATELRGAELTSRSAMYSSYYLVCRDLERRESR